MISVTDMVRLINSITVQPSFLTVNLTVLRKVAGIDQNATEGDEGSYEARLKESAAMIQGMTVYISYAV